MATSTRGMVSTARDLATEAAVDMLAQGGNAVDAAVTAALALAVCEPSASGLGGQTVMAIYLAEPGRVFMVDGSSRAPGGVNGLRLTVKEKFTGHKASTVPSTPAALAFVLGRYGSKSWAEAIAPAVVLARDGFPLSELQRTLTERWCGQLAAGPAGEVFLDANRHPLPVGTIIRQPALARTLVRLAEQGVEDFYQGRIASDIARDMARQGGLIRAEDLARIPWPTEAEPVIGCFDDLSIYSYGAPGAGESLLEMLAGLYRLPPTRRLPETEEGALLLARTIRRSLIGREDRHRRRPRHRSGGHTTHLSVMDRFGNAVSLTQSLERVYGARTMSPELGFLYNNYLGSFVDDDPSHPHYLCAGAVPAAQVAPTIVFKGGRPWLAIGSPGSERIAPVIAQVLLRLTDGSPLEAVVAPRLHCSVNGRVSLEAKRLPDRVDRALEQGGYSLDPREDYSFYLGCVQIVMRERNTFIGVADPRRDGSAGGLES